MPSRRQSLCISMTNTIIKEYPVKVVPPKSWPILLSLAVLFHMPPQMALLLPFALSNIRVCTCGTNYHSITLTCVWLYNLVGSIDVCWWVGRQSIPYTLLEQWLCDIIIYLSIPVHRGNSILLSVGIGAICNTGVFATVIAWLLCPCV